MWDIKEWVLTNDNWYILLIVYFSVQLVSVILASTKNVVLVKGKRITAALFYTGANTLGIIITYLVGNIMKNLLIIILTTMITNFVGVMLSLFLVDKLRKQKLWRISCTIKAKEFKKFSDELKKNKIQYITYKTDWKLYKLIDIFSYNRKESEILHKIFKNFDVKYTITSNSHVL